MRTFMTDLVRRNPWTYATDLLLSATMGWGYLFLAAVSESTPARVAALSLSVALLFRAVFFVHEISHMKRGELPGLRAAWDLLIGFPLLIPSFMYVEAHTWHHRTETYGTERDPEYFPYRLRGARWVLLSLLLPFLAPAGVLARFFVVGPVSWFIPRLRTYVEAHLSTLSIQFAYVRPRDPARARAWIVAQELGIFAGGVALVSFAPSWTFSAAPWWAAAVTGVALMNQIRILTAHRYEVQAAVGFAAQIQDTTSLQVPWALRPFFPLASHYHAIHHLAPSLPYHSVEEAHRRLSLNPDSLYAHAHRDRFTAVCLRALRHVTVGEHEPIKNSTR